MKLGKKALSCLLAVMMIVTSISVCFTVLGADATSQATNLFNVVRNVYDDLKNGWDLAHAAEPDTSRVPHQVSGSDWAVDVDGYHSGWQQTAKAFYNYVKVRCNGDNRTYSQAVDDAINYMRNSNGLSATSNPSLADVTNFLSYFKFGGTTASVTLTIGAGYDILAWAPNIDAIETERAYSAATVHFDTTSGNINPAGCTWEESSVVPENNTTVAAIKQALKDCVKDDAFKTWFHLDFDNMEVEEIMTLVQGDTSCASTLRAFSLVANLSGSADDEALWDAYVAPQVGKTWDETQDWVENGLMGAIYKAYAADYTEQLNAIMAEDTSAYTGAQKKDYYNRFHAICLALENQQDYKNRSIFDNILPYMADGFYGKGESQGAVANDLWLNKTSTVGAALATAKVNVAKQYTAEYADAFMELVDREVPTYASSSANQAAAWDVTITDGGAWDGVDDAAYEEGNFLDKNTNGVPDKLEAQAFVTDATAMIAQVDGDILAYGTFDDIKTVFASPNPNHENNPNRITESDYNALVQKIRSADNSINGAGAFLNRAKLDAFLKSTILAGQTYQNLQTIHSDFMAMYNDAKTIKDNGGELYALVFGNGWKTNGTEEENNQQHAESLAAADEQFQTYVDYEHLIKATAATRLWTKLHTIDVYFGTGVTYYTFEAILEACSNIEVKPTAFLNWLNDGIAYVADTANGEKTYAEIETLYNKVFVGSNSIQTKAQQFKSNLDTLLNRSRNVENADIAIQNDLFGSNAYAWRSSVGHITVEDLANAIAQFDVRYKSGSSWIFINDETTVRNRLDQAVKDLDTLLVSNDVGEILKSFLKENEEENTAAQDSETFSLAKYTKWQNDYTYRNPTGSASATTTVHKGDEIANLRELLINMIVDILYSGKIFNMIMQKLYPMVGNLLLYNVAEIDKMHDSANPQNVITSGTSYSKPLARLDMNPDIPVVSDEHVQLNLYAEGLTDVIGYILPAMPHMFKTGTGFNYYQLFNGSLNNGSGMNYPVIRNALSNTGGPYHGHIIEVDVEARALFSLHPHGYKTGNVVSYWDTGEEETKWIPQRRMLLNNDTAGNHTITASMCPDWTTANEDPQTAWKLNASQPQTLYNAMAASLGGLDTLISTLFTKTQTDVIAKLDVDGLLGGERIQCDNTMDRTGN